MQASGKEIKGAMRFSTAHPEQVLAQCAALFCRQPAQVTGGVGCHDGGQQAAPVGRMDMVHKQRVALSSAWAHQPAIKVNLFVPLKA